MLNAAMARFIDGPEVLEQAFKALNLAEVRPEISKLICQGLEGSSLAFYVGSELIRRGVKSTPTKSHAGPLMATPLWEGHRESNQQVLRSVSRRVNVCSVGCKFFVDISVCGDYRGRQTVARQRRDALHGVPPIWQGRHGAVGSGPHGLWIARLVD